MVCWGGTAQENWKLSIYYHLLQTGRLPCYRCPAGQILPYHYSNVENGMELRRYWSTAACKACAIKSRCTPSKERRVSRWVHEHLIEDVNGV